MAAHVSESLVLRTYPFGEGDLIVSFLSRDLGKQRGVAKRARKSKSAFGASLERLSHTRITYTKRETRELVALTSAEMISSPFTISSYEGSVALDFIAEVSEHLLPPEEVNEKYFRLILSVVDHLRVHDAQAVWPSVTYFALWAVRLSGFLPTLRLEPESVEIAEEMLLLPVAKLPERAWDRSKAADLRRLLIREIEQHAERRLLTVPLLDTA